MKIIRNMSTAKARAFWRSVAKDSAMVQTWPAWKRAGINVAKVRKEPRT